MVIIIMITFLVINIVNQKRKIVELDFLYLFAQNHNVFTKNMVHKVRNSFFKTILL